MNSITNGLQPDGGAVLGESERIEVTQLQYLIFGFGAAYATADVGEVVGAVTVAPYADLVEFRVHRDVGGIFAVENAWSISGTVYGSAGGFEAEEMQASDIIIGDLLGKGVLTHSYKNQVILGTIHDAFVIKSSSEILFDAAVQAANIYVQDASSVDVRVFEVDSGAVYYGSASGSVDFHKAGKLHVADDSHVIATGGDDDDVFESRESTSLLNPGQGNNKITVRGGETVTRLWDESGPQDTNNSQASTITFFPEEGGMHLVIEGPEGQSSAVDLRFQMSDGTLLDLAELDQVDDTPGDGRVFFADGSENAPDGFSLLLVDDGFSGMTG